MLGREGAEFLLRLILRLGERCGFLSGAVRFTVRAGELALESGLLVGDLVESVFDLGAKIARGLEFGAGDLQLAGSLVERRRVGRGLGCLLQRGEGLLGAFQFGLHGLVGANQFGSARLGGADLLLRDAAGLGGFTVRFFVVGGHLDQAFAFRAQRGHIAGEVGDLGFEDVAFGAQLGEGGILGRRCGLGRGGHGRGRRLRVRRSRSLPGRRGRSADHSGWLVTELRFAIGQPLLRGFIRGLVERADEVVEGPSARAVFPSEGKPHEALEGIDRDAATLHVSQTQVVLGNAVAFDCLGPERGDLAAILGGGGEAADESEQENNKRAVGFHTAGKGVWADTFARASARLQARPVLRL